jgi:hypothetical protein
MAKQARELGFQAQLNHDSRERTIQVRFVPETARARQAVRAATESDEQAYLLVQAAYGEGDSPGELAAACIEKGLEELRQAL